jgi:lysophospholipase L1-like esterase
LWYVAGSDHEDYLVHGYTESADGCTSWNQEFSDIIREIARQEGTAYVAVYETIVAQITKSPGRAFTEFEFLSFYRDAFRTLVLRKSPDEVGRINDWRFHSDGIHLNSRSGLIVADLIQKFIDS